MQLQIVLSVVILCAALYLLIDNLQERNKTKKNIEKEYVAQTKKRSEDERAQAKTISLSKGLQLLKNQGYTVKISEKEKIDLTFDVVEDFKFLVYENTELEDDKIDMIFAKNKEEIVDTLYNNIIGVDFLDENYADLIEDSYKELKHLFRTPRRNRRYYR